MPRPMIRIHDSQTDEVIDREMNDAEFNKYKKDLLETQAREEMKAELSLKKTLAEQKLTALGLTLDDLKVLGLG